jgi:predicted ATPase
VLDDTSPETVRQRIDRALDGLDPSEADLLEAGAVVGTEFDGATTAAATEQTIDEVERVLGYMSRQVHYLEAIGGSSWPDGTISTRFRFTHDLFRLAIHDRLSAARRAQLHGRVGAALEEGHEGRLGEVCVDLARHFLEAGDDVRAVEYLSEAGEQASARNAHGHAAELLLRALDRLKRLPGGAAADRAELRVRLALGPTLVATRGWYGPEVFENYERATTLAQDLGADQEASLARYGMATVLELRGEYARTKGLLVPMVEHDAGGLAVETRELLACSTFHQGSFQQSLDSARSALEIVSGTDHHSALMSRMAEHPGAACNSWASLACWFLGRSDESLELAATAIELGEQNLYALSTARVQRAFLHQFRSEPEDCRLWAESAGLLAAEQGFPMREVQAQIFEGWVEAVIGSPEVGARSIAEGLDRFRSLGARLSEPYLLGLEAEALLRSGEAESALLRVLEAFSAMEGAGRSFFYESELLRLQAKIELTLDRSGRIAVARDLLDRAGAMAEALGSPPLALRVTIDRAALESELGDARPWLVRLQRWVGHYDGQSETVDTARARELLAASPDPADPSP